MNRLEWVGYLKDYSRPNHKKAAWQVINTFIPYIFMFSLSTYLVMKGTHLLVAAGAMLVAAAMVVRLFIFFHDCTHESFVKSKKWNRRIGIVLGVLTFTPYNDWKKAHGIHHGSVGNLEKRGVGDIWTVTVEEYKALNPLMRFWYRLYRNPFFLFSVAPFFLFVVMNRFSSKSTGKKEAANIVVTNIGILLVAVVFSVIFTPVSYLIVQGIVIAVAAAMGVWLFYIQHQFEDVYWVGTNEWNGIEAALKGSTFYKLPVVFEWVSGYIGYHHIHHLNPNIPNYHLKPCYLNRPELKNVKTVTLGSSFHLAFLCFYDEQKKQLISYKQLRAA